jgi:AmmeMemoRadiSam system protein B
MAESAIIVPGGLAPLLALCDGTRDVPQLRSALMLRTGIQLSPDRISDLVVQLDGALLLENGAYKKATAQAMKEYREAKYRTASHAGIVYQADAEELTAELAGYCDKTPADSVQDAPEGTLAGMVSPHIDFMRGYETYARLWRRAAPSLEDVELVLVFGTDHAGGPGALTPTRQNYQTPLGMLPTDTDIVDGLAEALGLDSAFAEEHNHIREHSIELVAVWLQYFLRDRVCPVVPVLCGSYHEFVMGVSDPGTDEKIEAAVAFLREATAGRRTLVVAAADLAHVGPAFGDTLPVDPAGRAALSAKDRESLTAICGGDAGEFFQLSRNETDSRRVCGLPPIYMTLRILDGVRGESLGYAQCPADADGGSLVSIAGVLLYQAG